MHYLKRELYELVGKSPEIFEFLQAGCLDGIRFWDLESPENEWVSPRFWEVLGHQPSEKRHLASEWQESIDPEDFLVAKEDFERHCADPSHPFDQTLRFRHQDGSILWLRCRGIAIRDDGGKPRRFLGTHVDITERKRAEAALRESEAGFRTLVEHAPEAIVVLDVDTSRFVDANQNALDLFGLNREELFALGIFEVSASVQAGGVRAEEAIGRDIELVMAGETPTFEWIHTDADGREILCEIRLVRLPSWKRRLVRGSIIDITERRSAERQLRTSLREKETLLREVHHRVKNNLQIISSLLNFQAKKVSDPDGRAVFREGQDRLRSMILVHEQLYQSPSLSEIDFAEYLRCLADQLGKSYASGQGEILLQVETEAMSLPIETALPCGMIVNELLANAFKHAFPDGRPGRVWVKAERNDGCVELSVCDDGIGLPSGIPGGFGMQLLQNLCEQIEATVTFRSDGGTVALVAIPEGPCQ